MFACIYGPTIADNTLLMDFAYSFSPLVEGSTQNTVVMDIEGCELLFGSAYELANDIASRAAKSKAAGGLGCKVNVAVAANPDAVVFAARFLKGITFISPGEELTGLGDLPIEALLTPGSKVEGPTAPDQSPKSHRGRGTRNEKKSSQETQEIFETLRLWGVQTFRDFAALPINGVSERLGREGLRLQQLAAGKSDRHLNLVQPAPDFENSIELEHPIAELEPLAFILARLLNQVCAKLHAYAFATNELRLKLKLEDGILYEHNLTLPCPMRDHKVFLKLLLLNTETYPPQSPVVAVSIACEPVKPCVLQDGLFIPLAPEPEKLELTLARLGKLVGANNIGSPELIDTHRPGTFRIKRFALKETSLHTRRRERQVRNSQEEMRKCKCFLGFRVFRPPLPAVVEAARGYPTRISAPGKSRSVMGKVVQLAGPWRTSGDWWCTDSWARDEWDVAIESRAGSSSREQHTGPPRQVLYRIYRELNSRSWFIEGIYD
ncbi:MAG TPA: hypothetical protein VGJ55_01340 [Pyrinomonadaceae bacterium]|jgi:protein ImuB